MRDERVGAALRAIRIHAGLRQRDLATRAGVSQSRISLIELGQLGAIPLRALRASFEALGADLAVTPRWNGAALDRLLDERHALLSGEVLRVMRGAGWEVLPEVSFSHYAERGSIDLLGARRLERIAVVTEVKTELGSFEETQRRLDTKVRLAPAIVFDRLGWRPSIVARLLVLPEGRATRNQLVRHRDLLEAALPNRGWAIRQWLEKPSASLAGLWVLSNYHDAGRTRISPTPRRVRRGQRARRVPSEIGV